MVAKNNSIVAPATSALTPATITRLNTDNTNLNSAIFAVTLAQSAEKRAMGTAETNRGLITDEIGNFFKSLNVFIDRGAIPQAARADYTLAVGNKKSPLVDTDPKRLLWGQKIIDGDLIRVTAGGIPMANPSIIEFTAIFDTAKTALTALNTAKDAVGTKQAAVKLLMPEMKKLIKKAWNEIETTFSDLDPSAKRAAARLWGVKYVSVGLPAVVSGVVTDSVTTLPLANVKVRISGAKNKVLTNALGEYTLNTNLYGDLELITDLVGYTQGVTDFLKANGVDMTVNVVMEHV